MGRRLGGVIAALLLAFGAMESAPTGSAGAEGVAPKPTIVLVHGAWADSSGWNGVVERLQRDRFPVMAPANPLRSLAGDAEYLSSVVASIPGPVILVGHSYGGAVITNGAGDHPNVQALVFIAAFAPDAGESIGALAAKYPGSHLPTSLTGRPYRAGGGPGVDLYIDPAKFSDAFVGDVPAATAAVMAAEQRPLTLEASNDKSGPPAWKSLPSWYMVAKSDHAIPPEAERFMAKRAGSQTVEVEGSHAVMVAHPDEVTELIEAAVAGVAH